MGSFRDHVARRLRESRGDLGKRCLERVVALVPSAASDAAREYTGDALDLVASALEEELGEAGAATRQRAGQLAERRLARGEPLRQVLLELDVLAGLVEELVADEHKRLAEPDGVEGIDVLGRVHRATRTLALAAVDTFVADGSATAARQRAAAAEFDRMLRHEMRGPLNTLRIAAAVLAEKDSLDAAERKTLLDLVQGSVDRSCALLDDLQTLSDLRGDESPQLLEEVDLDRALHAVAVRLAALAADNEVEIVVEDAAPPAAIDAGKLGLALTHLVGNAIRYCDRGKDRRFVCLAAELTAGDAQSRPCLAVTVSDNGVGISDDELPKIFDPFFRGRNARAGDGTGLGLAIAWQCAESLGGRIEVASREGEGTRFTLTLPLAR